MPGSGSRRSSRVRGEPGPLRRAVAAHLESHDVTRVIYGTVIGLALVVSLESHPPTAGESIAWIVGTAVAVGLAEMYSEVIGAEARTRRPIEFGQVRTAALEAAGVLFGAAFPALFFVLAAAGVMGVPLAFTLSKWTGLALICAYGFVAGRLSGAGVGRALVQAAAVGAVGGVLIGLKALLH
jgi:hypothetical protein